MENGSRWEPSDAPAIIARMSETGSHVCLRVPSEVYNDLAEYLAHLQGEKSAEEQMPYRQLAAYDRDEIGKVLLRYRLAPGYWTIIDNDIQFDCLLCRRIDQIIKGRTGPELYLEFHLHASTASEIEELVHKARKYCNPSASADRIVCKRYSATYWSTYSKQVKRDIQTLFLPHDLQQSIVEEVQAFLSSEQEYRNFGMPYKRVYLLSGRPGTGKTSLVYALASHFNLDLYMFGFDQNLDDTAFHHAMGDLGTNSVLLMEDVDQGVARDKISLSAITNALDGVCFRNRMLVFMTTNHLDQLDPVLIRSGRVDRHIKFDHATQDQISAMLSHHFHCESDPRFAKMARRLFSRRITTAALSGFLFKHRASTDILGVLEEHFEEIMREEHGEPVSYIM